MFSSTNRRLAAAAAVLATLALFAGDPPAREPAAEISAIELADRIRERDPRLLIIDLRTREAFNDFSIPTAQNITADDVPALRVPLDASVVLYGHAADDVARAVANLKSAGARNVRVLRGGPAAWLDEVMSPVLSPAMPEAERAKISGLSRYFGGQPRLLEAGKVPASSSADVAGRVPSLRRRGCGM